MPASRVSVCISTLYFVTPELSKPSRYVDLKRTSPQLFERPRLAHLVQETESFNSLTDKLGSNVHLKKDKAPDGQSTTPPSRLFSTLNKAQIKNSCTFLCKQHKSMAKGLIPLMLSSPDSTSSVGSRPSVVAAKSPTRASYSPPVSPAHRRNQSDVTPIIKLSRPPVRSSMKRQSQQIPASLPQIPYSSAEWKRAINEIKRYHVTRRYRACSARCNEILTNIKTIVSAIARYEKYIKIK